MRIAILASDPQRPFEDFSDGIELGAKAGRYRALAGPEVHR
jgi:hypothetical protein